MPSSFNFDDCCDDLAALIGSFGFSSAGEEGRSLGEDAAHAIAESISEDAREGNAPDGSAWARNAEKYARWKQRKVGHAEPGYLTGQTLSITALVGELEISGDQVVMTHGTGQADKTGATDREKGQWLTDGDSNRNRPERPYYELNDKRCDKVQEIMANGLGKHVGEGV